MYSDNEFTNDDDNIELVNNDDDELFNNDDELVNVGVELTNNIYSKKTSLKMNAPSFTYDNKTITVTHNMTLHITIPDSINFQRIFYKSSPADEPYFLELMNIIFTTLISKVPDNLTFKLYTLNIPSHVIPHKFARDAFEILKPLILSNPNTLYTYERYFIDIEWVDETSTDE